MRSINAFLSIPLDCFVGFRQKSHHTARRWERFEGS